MKNSTDIIVHHVDSIPSLRRKAEQRVRRSSVIHVQPAFVHLQEATQRLEFWLIASSRNRGVVERFVEAVLDGSSLRRVGMEMGSSVLAVEVLDVEPHKSPASFAVRFVKRAYLKSDPQAFVEADELIVGLHRRPCLVMEQQRPGHLAPLYSDLDMQASPELLLDAVLGASACRLACWTMQAGYRFVDFQAVYFNGQLQHAPLPPPVQIRETFSELA